MDPAAPSTPEPGRPWSRWPGLVAALLLLAVGAHLRTRDVAELALLHDEHHAITSARDHTLAECFTYYQRAHNTVPLTMYARLLIEAGRLDELTLRLPSLVAGLLLLLLVPLFAARRWGGPAGLLVLALVATSPPLVYFSFVARPYAVTMLLLTGAFIGWDAWTARRARWGLAVFAVLSALAVFTLVVAAFLVAGLSLLTLVAWRRGAVGGREVLAAAAVTGLLLLALVVPGLPALLEVTSETIGAASLEPRLAHDVLARLTGHLGGTSGLLGIAWVAGLVHVARREPLLGLAGLVVPLAQVLGLLASAPFGGPEAWARYVLLAWPVVLLFAAVGLAALVAGLARHLGSRRLQVAVLVAALLVLGARASGESGAGPWDRLLAPLTSWGAVLVYAAALLGALARRLAPSPRVALALGDGGLVLLAVLLGAGVVLGSPVRLYARDVDTFRVTRRALWPERRAPLHVHPAYRELAAHPEAGETLLECPAPIRAGRPEWVPYSEYQRIHGLAVVVFRPLPRDPQDAHANVRTVLDPGDLDAARLADLGIRHAFVHLDYAAELELFGVAERERREADFDRQVRHARHLLFRRWGPPIAADGILEVYDLGGEELSPEAEIRFPWVDLGGATPGPGPAPRLVLTGPLTPCSFLDLRLGGAPPGATVLLLVSFASRPVPQAGGTLHAFPVDEQVVLTADDRGLVEAFADFPGAPDGTRFWVQALVEDAGARPSGAVLSNAVVGTVP